LQPPRTDYGNPEVDDGDRTTPDLALALNVSDANSHREEGVSNLAEGDRARAASGLDMPPSRCDRFVKTLRAESRTPIRLESAASLASPEVPRLARLTRSGLGIAGIGGA
jgi:hypothetical protein